MKKRHVARWAYPGPARCRGEMSAAEAVALELADRAQGSSGIAATASTRASCGGERGRAQLGDAGSVSMKLV